MRRPPPAVPAVLFLLLHLLPLLGVACLWGVDAPAYLSAPVRIALAAGALALFVPSCFRAVRVAVRPAAERPVLLAAALAGGATAVLLLLRSASPLLGDGILHLHDFERLRQAPVGFRGLTWANNNAPLANWIYWAVQKVGGSAWAGSLPTFRVVAGVSGAAWVVLATVAAWRLAKSPSGRALILAFLLTAGWMQLFAGYVELYAPLPPLILGFLLLGAAGGRRGGWGAAIALGVLVPLHFATVFLVPALLFVPDGNGTRGERATRAVGRLVLAAGVAAVVLALLGFDAAGYLRAPRAAWLPLGEPGPRQAYSLLAPAHLRDVLSQILLVAPAAAMGIALLGGTEGGRGGGFLGAAAAGPLAALAVANPEVGAFRDWDALAFAGIPLTLWIAVRLARGSADRVARTAFLVGGAAGIHTLAWLAVNADAAAADERFRTLLETCPVSVHATAYGWETLGQHRLEIGRRQAACEAFERAARAAPDNPRYWYAAGRLHLEAGRTAEAETCLRTVLRLDPDAVDAVLAVGTLALARGDVAGARAALTRFLELEPRGPRADDVRRRLAALEDPPER